MYSGNRRYRARRWLRWGLVYVACVAALAVIGLVIEAAVSPGKSPKSLMPTALPTPPWAQSASPVASPGVAGTRPTLTGPVQLVQGRELINGVALGFPHSTSGAVSAADALISEIGSTLDPDRAAAIVRMTADPSSAGLPQQAAQGAVNDRKQLGLPASGPLPSDVSVETEPVEYQVRDVAPDSVLVLLLSDITSTLPASGTQTQVGVIPVPLHWAVGDWKVMPAGPGSYSSLAAEPDSPQAAARGWQQLIPSGG